MSALAIEYAAPGEMQFADLGEPPPLGATEVLMRTQYSGITNGTERHGMLGEYVWTQFPSRHGYQQVGEVTAVGEAVTEFAPGDRVFYGSYVGHRSWNVADVGGEHLGLKLPGELDPQPAALFGVAGVAVRAVRRCRISAGARVWVVGLGLIGQFTAQAARAAGAHVTVTDLDARRLALAAELGAHRTLDARDSATAAALREGGPYDAIMDCAGQEALLTEIHRERLLARRGVVGLIAVRSSTTFPWSLLHPTEGSLEVSCHFRLDDLGVLLHFVRTRLLRIEPLITHRVPVAEAPTIYATLRDRPSELLGVVFDWSAGAVG